MQDIIVPIATSLGAAIAAAISAYRLARGKYSAAPRDPSVPHGHQRTLYVRLSAEDSKRVEKIDVLLERLIAQEEQTQASIMRLTEQISRGHLDDARRYGALEGRLEFLLRKN